MNDNVEKEAHSSSVNNEADLSITDNPHSNQSLLLKILDSGSDSLPTIFSHVTSLKERVRLERVCRSFRRHARTFQAWSDVKNIVVKGVLNYWINEDRIQKQSLKLAVESIILHSQNVRVIDLRFCDSLAAFTSIANLFMQARVLESVHFYRKLHRLTLGGQNSLEISTQILLMVSSLKSQLKCLKVSHIVLANTVDMARLWTTIGECVNLEIFTYYTNDAHISSEMVKSALRGKAIKSLYLNLSCLTTTDVIEIIASFSDAQSLQQLIGNSQYMSLADLALNLPTVHWGNMTKFVYFHFDSLSNTSADWKVILNLPHIAPKLTTLVLKLINHYSSGFEMIQATELIVGYLTILNQRKIEQLGKFNLCMLSKSSYSTKASHSWDWEKVLVSLANEHNCKIERIPGEIVRIRRSDNNFPGIIEVNNKL